LQADHNNEVKSAMSVAGTLQLQPTGLSKDAEISKTHKWPKKLPSRIPAKPLAAGEEQHAVVPRTLPGDSTALSLLFARERTRLYRAAFSILRNKEDAEDALQIGMLSAYTNLSSFEGRSSLATWVTRIVLNTALMNRRKQRARAQLSLDEAICDQPQTWAARLVDPRPDPEHSCALTETEDMVTKGMEQLSPALRSTFQLRYIVDLSAFEAAETESVNVSATKSRAWRARKQLARLLAAKGVNLWRGEIRRTNRFSAGVQRRRQLR
jgi:RNA polymerase sigma-70 factor (ECF subfamily)